MLSVWLRVIRVRFLLASVIAVSVGLAITWWQTLQMVNKKLIFLTETIGDSEILNPKEDYGIEEKTELLKPLYPKMFFIEKKYLGDKTNWWVTNESANEALIRASGLRIVEHPKFGIYLCEPKVKTKPLVINNKTLYYPNIPKFLDE